MRKSTKRQTFNSKQSQREKIVLDIIFSNDSSEPSSPPKHSVSPPLTDAFCRQFSWFKGFTHVSSESSSSDFEDSYKSASKPESKNLDFPISVIPLATKFPSSRRKTLQLHGGPDDNLEQGKMSDDS